MLGSFVGIVDYGAFVVAVIVFLLIPGPGNLALIVSTSKGGIAGGMAATFGVIAGDQLLLWAAVTGVSALLAAYPAALLHIVQWSGAVYLAWLGLKMVAAGPGRSLPIEIRPRQYVRQAMLITLLNPKAIVFYMAFFPLFIDPSRHLGLRTFATMAATVAVLTLLYGSASVLLTHHLAGRIRANPRASAWLGRIAGVFLVGFGLKLAASR